jgi:hypothetical protein
LAGAGDVLSVVEVGSGRAEEGDYAAHGEEVGVCRHPNGAITHATVKTKTELPVRIGIRFLAVQHTALGVIVSIAVIEPIDYTLTSVCSRTPSHAYPRSCVVISV